MLDARKTVRRYTTSSRAWSMRLDADRERVKSRFYISHVYLAVGVDWLGNKICEYFEHIRHSRSLTHTHAPMCARSTYTRWYSHTCGDRCVVKRIWCLSADPVFSPVYTIEPWVAFFACRPFRSSNHSRFNGDGVIPLPFHAHSICNWLLNLFLSVFLFLLFGSISLFLAFWIFLYLSLSLSVTLSLSPTVSLSLLLALPFLLPPCKGTTLRATFMFVGLWRCEAYYFALIWSLLFVFSPHSIYCTNHV